MPGFMQAHVQTPSDYESIWHSAAGEARKPKKPEANTDAADNATEDAPSLGELLGVWISTYIYI